MEWTYRKGADSRESALCLLKPESMVGRRLRNEEGPGADMELSHVHTESGSKACHMHPSNRSLRTSEVPWTQEGAVCPVWPAALEPTVSRHCSFPEMPSGYLEVSTEEGSGWCLEPRPPSHSSRHLCSREKQKQKNPAEMNSQVQPC